MRLYLLRHGEVASHRGDVPITPTAGEFARRVGSRIATDEPGRVRVLSGETRRARDTAAHVVRGMRDGGAEVNGPEVAFALRNPDLYVNGVRVDMVSSPESLASQVDGLSPGDVGAIGFFSEFFASRDRIGWWLVHETPPGETAAAVASRMRSFVRSLADPTPMFTDVVVAVTHSPLVRSVAMDHLGRDIGEPPWVSGLLLTTDRDGRTTAEEWRES